MTDIIQAKKTAPQGYHYTNAGVLPNEWTSRPLSSIVEEITETAGTREIETVSISAGVGFVNQAEKFGKELSGKQYEKYTVLHRGDFSYNKGNSNLYPQGCIYRLNDRTEAAVPNVFESFRVSDGNPDFYEQLFISGFLNRQLYSRINRGVRDDGLLNLRGNDFYSCEVPCPPLAEQERIAEILMQCDKIIELKQKRIAEEKKKKEALIHRLLRTSKEALHDSSLAVGKEGTLKDVVSYIESGTSVNSIDKASEYVSEKRYVLKTSAIFEGAFLLEESKEVVAEDYYRVSCPIEANTLLVSRMNTPKLVGACALCDVTLPNVFLPDRLWKVVLKKNVDPRWLNYVISSESSQRSIRRKAGGTSNSMKNISQKDFLDIPIVLPSYDEQVSIANIIAAVDEVIKKLYEEIGMWGNKKRALMQMLLTGIVRVKV